MTHTGSMTWGNEMEHIPYHALVRIRNQGRVVAIYPRKLIAVVDGFQRYSITKYCAAEWRKQQTKH